ncbi:MAG: TlpA family protein disulfide reductase [Clostridiales bacterium]|nr:TlpA family protein disulfide reductase [Clostridiales bacterium]
MKRLFYLAFSLLLILALTGCGSPQPEAELSENEQLYLQIMEKTPLPEWVVLDENGDETVLRTEDGTFMVINLWASWCGYCIHEIPYLNAAADMAGDDVHFAALNVLDSASAEYTYDEIADAWSAMDDLGIELTGYVDHKSEAAAGLYLRSVPMTLFVDGENNIRLRYPGAFSSAEEIMEWLSYVQKYAD